MDPIHTPEIIPTDPAVPVAVDPQGNNEPAPTTPPAPSQKFTKRERLEFSRAKIESQLAELDDEEDDSKPVTHGDLKKMRQTETRDTALQLAESITDELEKTEVIQMLEGRIVPSDNPQKDLELARNMVNAQKNAELLAEQARKITPGNHANTPSAPGHTPDTFTPTAEEVVFMSPPYNLTKEEVIAGRNRAQG